MSEDKKEILEEPKSNSKNMKALKDWSFQFKGKKVVIKKGDDVKKQKLSDGLLTNLRTEKVI